jgi:hypothetical protein
MRDLEKENINRIFKDKKLKWCGNFFGPDDDIAIPGFNDECYEFTFQITDIKPMISFGEWYDYAAVDVTAHLKDSNILTKFVSKGTYNTLMPFIYFKNSLRETIIKALKPVSDLKVMVTNINPVIEKTENINESKMYRSVIRDVIKDIISVVKQDLHANKVTKLGKYGSGNNEFVVLVKQNLSTEEGLLSPVDVNGYWDEDNNLVEIEIDIDPNSGSEVLYELIGELNDVIRHELEHKKQYLDDYDFPSTEYKQPLRYYTQPHEIEAQIAGFKRIAKLQKRSLDDVMMNFFQKRKKKYNLSNSTIKKIIERIKEYGQV